MGSSIIKRLALAVPLVVLVSIVTFALLHLAPGGPAGVVSGNPKTTGEDMARIRQNYGLDRSLPVQSCCSVFSTGHSSNPRFAPRSSR